MKSIHLFIQFLLFISATNNINNNKKDLQAVGFEPTSVATSELESDPLDRSGTLASCNYTD